MPIDQKTLDASKQKWNEQIEALARHLCVMKGEEPDKKDWPGLSVENWRMYIDEADQYLRRRAFNKYYWENLAGNNNNDNPSNGS